ncbi:RE1, partial [Symbiodinium sp. CCMP2456]
AAQLDLVVDSTEAVQAVVETTSGAVQAELTQQAPTTLDLGRRSPADRGDVYRAADAAPGEFVTPKSASTPKMVAQSAWLGGVDPPRWLQRLSSLWNVPSPGAYQVEMAPSPYPGVSPPYTPPPPGGRPFRLASPGRPRAIPPAPSPPSSSSVPAEAIQAEVQRQLGGILAQLKDFGERNEQLQLELDDTRVQLRKAQEERTIRYQMQYFTVLRYHRVLDYLRVTIVDNVAIKGAVSQLNRGQTPPPPVSAEGQGSPVLDALTRGVQQLQELQAQAMFKASTTSSLETVKPGTISLTMMPDMKTGADSALAFQDWLEVSYATMCDISEGSADWWSDVMETVEQVYASWLAASPLEKLSIDCEILAPVVGKVQSCADDASSPRWSKYKLINVTCRQKMQLHEDLKVTCAGTSRKLLDAGEVTSDEIQETPKGSEEEVTKAQALVQAAQQVVQVQAEARGDSSPEKTKPEVKMIILKDIRVCSLKGSTTALVDSGATHSLRTARSEAEWAEAELITVQLAGSHFLTMRITKSGTLLMPPSKDNRQCGGSSAGQTIVPMGQLIQVLGYSMYWSPAECYLEDRDGRRIPLQTEGGCPQLCELEALTMIARLEDRKLEELKNTTMLTKDKVQMSAVAMERTWDVFLLDYVTNGTFESGLRSVRDAPFFRDVPGECLSNLIPPAGLWSGWSIMKQLGFFTRAQRRRILNAKRWVVHLFAGAEGHYEIMKLDQGDTVVIELDIARCQGMDLLRSETWRMLMWGAKEGKIDAIIGGPPDRSHQRALGGSRDVRALSLVSRIYGSMLWRKLAGRSSVELEQPRFSWPRTPAEALPVMEELHPGRKLGCGGPIRNEKVCGWYRSIKGQREDQQGLTKMILYQSVVKMTVCGRLDPTSKGTTGRNIKYLLVAKYVVPKAYVELFSGQQPPPDDGMPEINESKDDKRSDKEMEELFGDEEVPKGPEETIDFDVEVANIPGECDPGGVDDGDMDYEPSIYNEEEDREVDDECPVQNTVMAEGDCEAPEMTYLMFATGLPNNQAMTVKRGIQAACAMQRSRVLGWKSYLAAPYGSTVHLRRKPFDKYGPLKREQTLESKWHSGRYVGLSTILQRGHLVYVPQEGEEKEKFFHTLHVRPNLVDPGGPDVELRADEIPRPRRRVLGKTDMADVEMKVLKKVPEEVHEIATAGAEALLRDWDHNQACDLVKQLAGTKFFADKKFGVYRHGGSVGWLAGIIEYPALTKLLVRVIVEVIPDAAFTSVLVSNNTPKQMHKDINNDYNTKNYVVPICIPSRGGDLWIELKEGDVVHGQIEQRCAGEKHQYGQLRPLRQGEGLEFGPRRYHEVSEWEGDRIVVIGYTPDCLGKLSQDDIHSLHEYHFPVPLSQLPEFYGDLKTEGTKPSVNSMQDSNGSGQATSLHEQDGWIMYLDLGPGMVKIAEDNEPDVIPRVQKAEVGYTKNIEQVLQKLTSPLEVVHNVSPDEVMSNLEAWRAAIVKEVKGVEVAIERLLPGSDARKKWVNAPGVQRLPMKFVFTVKPNDGAVQEDKSTWYKRKARLVICGNMARAEETSLYAETAPAEAVRAALAIASRNQWLIAILDVVAAFLKTPLGRQSTDPVVIAQPPRLLEALGLAERFELWALVRALYGLREAPRLWTTYRDATMQTMTAPRGLKWKQGRAITSWWTLRDKEGAVQAIVVVYVDDFLLCGPREVVLELTEIIQQVWDTSELTVLGPTTAVRFLGMELHRETETMGEITVHQQGFIQELVRTHGIKPTNVSRVPITKELAMISDQEEGISESAIKDAQQLTGEVLWVAQRSRPDLAYTTSMMASMCTRTPSQAIQTGIKAIGYLLKTIKYGLKVRWSDAGLVMFCDAAYAPQGGRSHGGWVVTFGGVPIVWRSGRQQMITLSTAEAELLSMIDGAIAMKGVEALLLDVGEVVETKEIASDSMAALSISSGSTSWRTRHLRIKAGWLQEQITHGLMHARHCPGEVQPADLLTKALSYARMTSLLTLWGVGGDDRAPAPAVAVVNGRSRLTVALVCCLLVLSVQASEDTSSSSSRGSGIQVDSDLIGVMMLSLMGLGALLIWEGLKWMCLELYHEYTPGASKRKLKKLRKLQAATTEAIERELDRIRGGERDEPTTQAQSGSEAMPEARPLSSATLRLRGATRVLDRESRHASDLVSDDQGHPSTPWTAMSTPTSEPPRTPSPGLQPTRSSLESRASRQAAVATWDEIARISEDVCRLMTCESLREGLRTEALPVSGLKDDQVCRLGGRLAELAHANTGPTAKQLRYVLWLWREKDMSGRHNLKYCEVCDRARISSLIAQWMKR